MPGLDEGVDLVDGLLFGVVFSGEPGSHGAYFFLLFIFYMQYNRDFDYFLLVRISLCSNVHLRVGFFKNFKNCKKK